MSQRRPRLPHDRRFAYDGLDRVIHERARLGVLSSLIAYPKGLPFAELKQLCALTDGNLSRHLRVLQAAKLVEISKGFEHNRVRTVCRMTGRGRKRYLDYVSVLEQVILDAAAAVDEHADPVAARAMARA
jgi:DNA-binding MarR family transcriptional regulator